MNETIAGQPGVFLVFHGVDSVAEIRLNGIPLGLSRMDNMFVRYRFNIANLLKVTSNEAEEVAPFA